MSTIGLYSTLYARLAECAKLLDQTLIELKQQQENASRDISDQQKKLGHLLIGLAKKSSDLDVQLLITLLQDSPKKNMSEWARLGQALLENKVAQSDILKLEKLAKSLEYERANTFARMRGNNA
jgi:hypothetical protein